MFAEYNVAEPELRNFIQGTELSKIHFHGNPLKPNRKQCSDSAESLNSNNLNIFLNIIFFQKYSFILIQQGEMFIFFKEN